MRRSPLVLAGLAAALALPAAASAAPPANDAPGGAIAFSTVTAVNGTPTEKQGVADLTEATADAGVARCLGDASFARTVWYRVPASDAPKQVRVTGTGGSGQSAAQPDLAAFVVAPGAAPVQPQACDGPGVEPGVSGGDDGGAPQVDVRVPAGRDVLVQVGRRADQAPEPVVLSEAELALPAVASPSGDVASDGGALTLGTTTTVPLGGATVTEEDPAQPACPASGTVWRRFVAAGTGAQQVKVAGDAVSAVTAFVGATPTADNAATCTQRLKSGAEIALSVDAQAGQTVWVRLGTESTAPDAAAAVAVGGPGATIPGSPIVLPGTVTPQPGTGGTTQPAPGNSGTSAAKLPKVSVGLVDRRRKLRLRATGGSLRSVTVSVQRRRGSKYVTVATAKVSSLTSGKARTVTLKRRGSVALRGRYRFVLRARTATTPARTVSLTRTKQLGRL